MLSFVSFVIAAVLFALIGHKDISTVNEAWGFFFVSLGLALEYLPVVGGFFTRHK